MSPATAFAIPFTLPSGTVLTLGPHVVMQGSANTTPIALIVSGGGTLVNEGRINTPPSLITTVVVSTSLDNEGSLSIGHGLTVNGDLTNDGEISFVLASAATALTVNGNLTGFGTILIPPFLGGIPIIVTGTIGPQDLIGPVNSRFTVTTTSIDSQAQIKNFAVGSTIDLTGLAYSPGLQASYGGNNVRGLLSITNDDTLEALLTFLGIPTGATFALNRDPIGGTIITTDAAAVPCFVTGTCIRTDHGEIPVEQLRVGDRVPAVRAGRPLQIVWIGHRRVLATGHPQPEEVYPVRVAAGAFADAVPHRDLWLSPEHCVFLHGVLVPIRVLINGTSIVQVPSAEVTYWHVELERHDLMLCEGAWTESYLDMGNRSAFTGTADGNPSRDFSGASWEARACQQQERGGRIVAAIRAVIDARAAEAA